MDTFDKIRLALYQNKSACVTGVVWRSNWYNSNGIIPKSEENQNGGHAICVIGYKQIDGESYLIVQNSYGQNWGDKGFNYFPREVVNRDFTFGVFTFVDMPVNTAVILNKYGFSAGWSWLANLYNKIKDIF